VPSSDFVAAYEGTPRLAEAGEIRGAVLDAGCGTGENALFLSAHGLDVVGVDFVPAAIARAKDKADARGLSADFRVGDALKLGDLDRSFDTVIDCGLFHTFGDDERLAWVASLAAALAPGGRYFMLCFSEHEKGEGGPRRVTQAEIRATFAVPGWRVVSIVAARLGTHLGRRGRRAWLAKIERVDD
jgi:SAM-dependent methyltransferase